MIIINCFGVSYELWLLARDEKVDLSELWLCYEKQFGKVEN